MAWTSGPREATLQPFMTRARRSGKGNRVARRAWLLGGLGLCGALACGGLGRPDARPAGSPPRLRIVLYEGIGIHGYTYAAILPFLDSLDPAESLATVTEDDVESYRLHEARDGVDFVLTADASARLRALRPSARQPHDLFGEGPFVVFFDDRRLYGGLSYLPFGAAALVHPVIHWAEEDGKLVAAVRPVQAPFGQGPEEVGRIRPPELEAFFGADGRLIRQP